MKNILKNVWLNTKKQLPEGILEYWIQNTPKFPEEVPSSDFEMDENTTVDDLISLAIRLDNKLIEIYKVLAHSADSEEVRNVFEKLLEMEEREKITMVRQAILFNDL